MRGGGLLLSNNEAYGREPRQWAAGVRLFDVEHPEVPREMGVFESAGTGVHRMWFHDGRYAHLSASAPGTGPPSTASWTWLIPSVPRGRAMVGRRPGTRARRIRSTGGLVSLLYRVSALGLRDRAYVSY